MVRLIGILLLSLPLLVQLGCSSKSPPDARQASTNGEEGTKTDTADYNPPVMARRQSQWEPTELAPSAPAPEVENPAPSGGASPPAEEAGPPPLLTGNSRRSSSFLPAEPELPAEPAMPVETPVPEAPPTALPSVAPPPQFAPSTRLTLRSEVGDDAPPEPFLEEEPITPIPAPAQSRIKVGAASSSPLFPDLAKSVPIAPTGGVKAQGSSSRSAPASSEIMPVIPSAAERMGNKDHEVVEVFYATDRKPIHEGMEPVAKVLWRFCPVFILAGGTILCLGIALQRPALGIWAAAFSLGVITAIWTYVAGTVTTHNARYLAKEGPRFGAERGELKTGVCRVSIPRVHRTGELEAPSILRLELKEDVRKHLMLQGVYPLADQPFYQRMQARVANSERRELFVFIHGYNVTFEDAARRAAQMHYDLDFQGAPIFYSWPSQGELFKYTIDETNIAWTTAHFKQFIREVAEKSGARSINLIAHSMGNRALTNALKDLSVELQTDHKLFNQVVLAAPDIDAEVFKRDIAPAIQKTCENITLYASSHDQALMASKLVHGYPRAGESGANLVVIDGIDTIDVSNVETNFLGHSYYGDSDVILADVCNLLTESRPPQNRGWLTAAQAGTMTYWVFQGARAATHMPRTMRR